jgi:hypothetical protein
VAHGRWKFSQQERGPAPEPTATATAEETGAGVDARFAAEEIARGDAFAEEGQFRYAEALYRNLESQLGDDRSDIALRIRRRLEASRRRVVLFRSLVGSRHIPRHPFADHRDLLEIQVREGELAGVHVVRLVRAEEDAFIFAFRDGRERPVPRAWLARQRPLEEKEYLEMLRTEVEQKRAELGDAPSALDVFRLAFFCFVNGAETVGVPLLRHSLAMPGGGTIIDMFAPGEELRPLHRARVELVMAMAGRDDFRGAATPEPLVAALPEPDPVSFDDPIEEPSPGSAPASAGGGSDIEARPQWIAANDAYWKGLVLFRRCFGLPAGQAAVGLKEARDFFLRAQETLMEIADDFAEDATLEQRMMELQKLIYDCQKRQGV